MDGNERYEDSIGRWLEEAAPTRLPARVLDATFERTRRTRQDPDWRAVLGRRQMPGLVRALGTAAAVVLAAVLALNVGLIAGPGSTPSPSASASSKPTSGSMWPQSTLEEVRAAQELADAGESGYRWQLVVDGGQVGQHHPCGGASSGCLSRGGSAEIFVRFLEEELGWEAFFWDEDLSHIGGLDPGDVVFVRCALGLANPLYPTDPERPGCAPTIDELRYERVKVNVAQPDRQGPTGIWVVTGWSMIEPAEQIAPPSITEITAFLVPFFQARIDGEGAQAFVDFAENDPFADERVGQEIPLLYAASNGARYERSEFEVVDGPVWPKGEMQLMVRLIAENETVVEQPFSLERDDSGRLRLEYDLRSVTTENGKAVPVEYGFLDGVVTYRAAYPLEPSQDGSRDRDRLAIEGLLPDDDSPRRILFLFADPRPLGVGCVDAPPPADVDALVQSLVSDPDFEGSAPLAVTIGGLPAVQMDGGYVHAMSCGIQLQPIRSAGGGRLYLVDLPGGSARVLGIVISADEDSFETVLGWAMPVVDSIEFHAP